MPTAATLYAQRIAAARAQLAELAAALDADEARIAELRRTGGRAPNYADAGSMGYVVDRLGELIPFLAV